MQPASFISSVTSSVADGGKSLSSKKSILVRESRNMLQFGFFFNDK